MTREELFAQIDTNPTVAVSALIALFERQTADEQDSEATGHKNGMGFNGTDAGILSSFAKQAVENRRKRQAGENAFPTDLSPKQLTLLRNKLKKYGRQLLEIAEEKAARKGSQSDPVTVPAAKETLPVVNGFDIPPSCRVIVEGNDIRFPNAKEIARMTGGRWGTGTLLATAPVEVDCEFERMLCEMN